MPKNRNNLNYNYINKNQNRQIQNKEMQRFSHNPKDGLYNMMNRNQRYNNMNNGLNIINMDKMDNIGNNMVHFYQQLYNQPKDINYKYRIFLLFILLV